MISLGYGSAANNYKCDSVEYVTQLDISDLGSWIIKFRKAGIIVNNK